MHIGLHIPSFKYPDGTAAIRPKLKEIVTTAEESGFYSLWVMDHFYQIKRLHAFYFHTGALRYRDIDILPYRTESPFDLACRAQNHPELLCHFPCVRR